MLEVIHVSKHFHSSEQKVVAVDNVSLSVSAGEIYGLIGLSGAGKSTLIRCLNFLEKPDSGQILFEGKDLASLNSRELCEVRRQIGMIFQHFNLFMQKTVAENIAFPLRLSGKSESEINARVDELLDYIDLKEKRNAYPCELSGGQKQRVAIARALAPNPKLILCDEGTSALDPETTRSILDLLRRIVDDLKISVVMITHQMEVAKRICDRIAVLENGRMIEENTVEGLFLAPKEKRTLAFIQNLNGDSNETDLSAQVTHRSQYRLAFPGNSAQRPLISDISRRFGLDINLLSGKINSLRTSQVGYLIVEIEGNPDILPLALNYLRENGVTVEVLE